MRIITFLTLLFPLLIFSQKSFSVEYEADYKLSYKIKNTPNAPQSEAAFALLINKTSSYFKNMNKYIGDSLIAEKKLKESGNTVKDLGTFGKYGTQFPEGIGTTDAKIYFSTEIEGKALGYEEPNNISWKILNEYKTILGYKCRKAVTQKYGRKWIAYFSTDIPFPFGPYKFNNLPGLIVEIYDEKDDYHYTLYGFKKRKYVCKSANILNDIKTVPKEKIFDYQRNKYQKYLNRFDNFIENKEELEELKRKSLQAAKEYNPIELSIN